MRSSLTAAAVVLGLALAWSGRADDQADAKAIVEKAIKAMNRDKVAALKAATWKGKAKVYLADQPLDFQGEWFMSPPGKMRVDVEIAIMDMKIKQVRVVNGDKGWTKTGDTLEDMDKDTLAEEKHTLYTGWVAQLLALRDPAFQLAPLGESKVGDRPAVGIKVSRKDHRDVNLFFDKETSYLLKSETRIKDLLMGGAEVSGETLYLDYRDVDGVKEASKLEVRRDGKKFVESEINDMQRKEKLDDNVFAMP
jgi:hypothetical protein